MNKMNISILLIVGTMTTSLIGPTAASAKTLSNQQEINQIPNVNTTKYRSLREIESEIETKIRSKGYKNKEEYNMAIGIDFPIEESVYYNNLEYYTVAANTGDDERAAPAILALFGAKVLFKDWAKGVTLAFIKNVVGPGIAWDAIKKVGTNGREMVTVEGQFVGDLFYTKGHPVQVLQTALKNINYNLVVDGYWGPKTKEALKNFQKSQGLKPDGICGKDTWRKLYK